jgi:histidinol-phosphate aminotransferase
MNRTGEVAQVGAPQQGYTRRHLARIGSMLAAGAIPLFTEASFAQSSGGNGTPRVTPPDAVRIDLNEYPEGPCPEAVEAVGAIARFGNRYRPHSEQPDLLAVAAETEGLKPNYVSIGIGSSDPLRAAAIVFTSPTRSLVTADPVYETAGKSAELMGVKVHRIPLRQTDYAHDVKAMLKADPNAGLFYICSPNNPTGTVTSKEDLDYLLANKPAGSILLLDEAYIQFAVERSPAIDLVAADKDIIILRTFSKIYGMAGLRMGLSYGRPDLLQKMRPWMQTLFPITGIAAAAASLKARDLRPTRRKSNQRALESTLEFLEARNFTYIKGPKCNNFMIDVKRPGMEVIQALANKKVMICQRMFPIYPNHVRVGVGSMEEMAKFNKAFQEVMA